MTKAHFQVSMAEGDEDNSWIMEHTYFDEEHRSESLTFRQGKEPEKGITRYDARGQSVCSEYESGIVMAFEYEYYE